MIDYPYDDLINQRTTLFKKKENWIYINEKQGIPVRTKSGFLSIYTGKKGSGKTYACGITCTQFKNVIAFDPSPDIAFRKTLDEIGVEPEWNFWKLENKKGKNTLKFNICDCGKRVVEAIFYKIPSTDKGRKQKAAFEKYFSQNRDKKDWASFKQLCEDYKIEHYLTDFEKIFDKKDKGMDIQEIQTGKHSIWIGGIDIQTLSLGIFFSMLIENRGSDINLDYFGQDFLLVYVDEAQHYAKFGTSLGNSIANAAEQYRKLGIGLIVSGSAFKSANAGIHPSIRHQKDYAFIFKTEGSVKQYKDEGMDLIDDDWNELKEYECFCFDSRRDNADFFKVKFDNYFLIVRDLLLKNKKRSIIVGDETNYQQIIQDQLANYHYS